MQKESGDWTEYPDTPSGGGNMGSTNGTADIAWFADVLLDDHDYMTLKLLFFIAVLSVLIGAIFTWKLCRCIKKRSTYQDSIESALMRGKMYKPSVVESSKKAA